MILCDPPYGTTACKWDCVIPFEPMWAQLKRVIKHRGAIVITASQPFTSAIIMSQPKWFRHEWIWNKGVSNNFCRCHKEPLKPHESIVVFASGDTTYNPQKSKGKPYKTTSSPNCVKGKTSGTAPKSTTTINDGDRFPTTLLSFSLDKKVHPTQKPVALLEYLIRTYSNDGEMVLDFTMGSGSTGVAALNTNRRFIGIELDTAYCGIAKKRIQDVDTKCA